MGAEAPLSARLSYAQCWEDPDLLRAALQVGPDDCVLSIASGGCNSIDLDLAPRKRKPMLKRVIDPVMGKLMKPTPEELEGSDGAHSGVVLTPLETGNMGNIPMDRPEELPPLE